MNERRHPRSKLRLEWHRLVAPGVEVGEITTHGLALSRLKHGFESRWGHHAQLLRSFWNFCTPTCSSRVCLCALWSGQKRTEKPTNGHSRGTGMDVRPHGRLRTARVAR